MRSSGITLEYAEDLGGAEGRSAGGGITLRSGQQPAEKFATLVHELAHERLHHGEDRKSIPKRVRELEAEAVAFAVCRWAGLDPLQASSDYIQLYHGDMDALSASLGRIQTTAAGIIRGLTGDAVQEPDPEPVAAAMAA